MAELAVVLQVLGLPGGVQEVCFHIIFHHIPTEGLVIIIITNLIIFYLFYHYLNNNNFARKGVGNVNLSFKGIGDIAESKVFKKPHKFYFCVLVYTL